MAHSAGRWLSLSVPTLLVLACGSNVPADNKPSQTSAALVQPSLGTSGAFSVLAGTTVTNTGPTSLSNDLGVFPGSAITGFPPGVVILPATIHAADAVAGQAQSDLVTAYDGLAAQACTADMSGVDLAGKTLVPGVYCFASEALLSGGLVLDAQLDPSAVFVFKIASKLTSATNASVTLINGASPCNVFWQVGSSATIGTGTVFSGDIVALTSIALQSGASLNGRALARNGAVTLDNNQIRSDLCAARPVDGGTGGTAADAGSAGVPDAGAPSPADAGAPGVPDAGSSGAPDSGSTQVSCCEGTVACGGVCVDLQCDVSNCGACGHSCAGGEVCRSGVCAAPCP